MARFYELLDLEFFLFYSEIDYFWGILYKHPYIQLNLGFTMPDPSQIPLMLFYLSILLRSTENTNTQLHMSLEKYMFITDL